MNKEKITASYPIMLSAGKVFLDEQSVVAENKEETKSIKYEDIVAVNIQPNTYSLLLSLSGFRTNDVQLTLKSGDVQVLNHLTDSGTNALLERMKKSSLDISIIKSELQFRAIYNGLSALPNEVDKNLSSKIVYIILVILIIAFLIFMYKANSFLS